MDRQFQIARLDPDGLERLRALAARLQKQIMAYERGAPFANLTPEEVAAIRDLEQELGVVLLVAEG